MHPHHVVLTACRGIPALYSPRIQHVLFEWLARTARRYQRLVSQATVMADHIHLVVQSPKDGAVLSRAMQFFSSKLALALNRLLGRKGRVFTDRFFSRVIGTVSDLIRTIRYVAENPVRAGLVSRPEDWKASSLRAYLEHRISGSIFRYTGRLYGMLGFFKDPGRAMREILSGWRMPRVPGQSGRQLRLPFKKGLAAAS